MIKSNINISTVYSHLNNRMVRCEDRLLSLSPNFYSGISGALIGAAFNLLTGLVFEPQKANNIIILSIFLVFLSGICFLFLSIKLQELIQARMGEDKATAETIFRKKLNKEKKIFRILFIGSFFSIILIIFITFFKIKSG